MIVCLELKMIYPKKLLKLVSEFCKIRYIYIHMNEWIYIFIYKYESIFQSTSNNWKLKFKNSIYNINIIKH